jgi:hypothetical protein
VGATPSDGDVTTTPALKIRKAAKRALGAFGLFAFVVDTAHPSRQLPVHALASSMHVTHVSVPFGRVPRCSARPPPEPSHVLEHRPGSGKRTAKEAASTPPNLQNKSFLEPLT